jgi:hypothetical protein
MTKGLYEVLSGESYYVRANSEEEALAIWFVSQRHMEKIDYPQFEITDEDLDSVEYNGADTIAEFITEL